MNGSRLPGTLRVGRHVALAVLAAMSLFPIYYLLVNSLKGPIAFAEDQWLPPDVVVWENYARAWDVVARPILNTVVVVGGSLVALLVLAGLSAYAFAIVRFPGWRVLYGLTFVLLLIPNFLLLIPLYLQISRLPALAGGYLGIILPSVAASQAFSILVLKTAFEQIPRDLLEAARVDGAGELRVLTRIVVPLAWPVFASVAVIQCVALWNDYLLPQLVLDRANRTVAVALVAFSGDPSQGARPEFGPLLAGYVLSAIPLGLLFAFMMRSYIQGLTSGATKL